MPTPGPISNSHGDAHILGRANYVVTTSTHSGHYLVTNIVTLELRISASALVTRRAELYGILDLGGEDIGITRQTIVRNLRTGKTSHPPLLHTSVHVESMDPAGQVELDLEQFNVWIERQEALKKGEEDPYADFPLVSKSFKTASRTFATYVGARVTEVTREAEKHWKTPNACLKLTLTGPETLAPSHRARIFGKVAPTSVAASEEQVYSEPFGAGTYDGEWVHGGSSTTLATLPLHPGMAWEEYKAPASPWTPANKPGLKLTFYSKAGVAQATKVFELGPPPPVEVEFNGTADCDTTHGGIQCGGDTLHFDWHGSAELESAGAFPGLELWSLKSGHLDVTITGHLEKCEISGQQSVAMSPASIDTVSFALLAGTPQSYQLTITPGTETATVTTESCEKEEEEGKETQFPLSAIAYAKTPQPVSRPTPTGPISYSYSGEPDPGDPLYHFQWTITGVE